MLSLKLECTHTEEMDTEAGDDNSIQTLLSEVITGK